MGTKNIEETAGAAETEARDEAPKEGPQTLEPSKAPAEAVTEAPEEPEELSEPDEPAEDDVPAAKPEGVGQGAAAIVAAALGLIGLSGGWLGTVASARESLIGQLNTSQGASVGRQVQAVYGDSWKTTALVAGVFALAALVVGVVVLLRPAFGAPDRVQAPWIKSAAWAGVALGAIGLALAVAKYTDLLLGLPSTS
ncbi:hypothetical protein [Streptomyces spectabilis]|uniref:Uncharacterized protein n=1 Tax=Streptomyces spectabilis TaxID=68270 RepID=A0A516RDW1_STRST|nr:hypothetical protein [Streptomyces spectabilis]QDQ13846.1 hypothetical protein FH965_27495 [Streptomyces spectabilis]